MKHLHGLLCFSFSFFDKKKGNERKSEMKCRGDKKETKPVRDDSTKWLADATTTTATTTMHYPGA